jgi:hypothetical protein
MEMTERPDRDESLLEPTDDLADPARPASEPEKVDETASDRGEVQSKRPDVPPAGGQRPMPPG